MSQSLITIVIPTYNHLEDALKPCIERVIKYTDLSNKEVVVVANGCNDGTIEYLENLRHNKIRYIEIKEACGYIRAVNAGIKNSNTEFVVLLDNDAFLLDQNTDDWIKYLQKPLDDDPLVAASGSCTYRYQGIGEVIQSCCAMYRRQVLIDLNYFSEDYNPGYFSDYDICARINKTKYKCAGAPYVLEDKDMLSDSSNFTSPFPLYHGSTVQTMNKSSDRHLVLKNRSIFYRRHLNYSIYDFCISHGDLHHIEQRVRYLDDFVDAFFIYSPNKQVKQSDIENHIFLSKYLHKIHIIENLDYKLVSKLYNITNKDLCIISADSNIISKEQLNECLTLTKSNHFNNSDSSNEGFIGLYQELEAKFMLYQNQKKKFSIIIPTYNNFEACLYPCIESIFKNTDMSDTEIIVVANGCKDGTKAYLDSKKNHVKTLWYDEPLGYTVSTNIGIQAASGEFLVLLNNDNEILDWGKNGWISSLYQPFVNDEKVAITGSSKSYHQQTNTEFLLFYCVMIKKSIITEIGLLDEQFNPGYGEDIDYCRRVKNAGYKIVQVPNDSEINSIEKATRNQCMFPIWHKGSVTVHKLNDWSQVVERNEDILLRKYIYNYDELMRLQKAKNHYKQFNIGLYLEIFEYNFYRVHEDEIKNKNVIDIGANIGVFSLLCRNLGAKRVIGFEPDDKYYHDMQLILRDVDRIECRKEAVYAQNITQAFIDTSFPCPRVIQTETAQSTKCVSLHDLLQEFQGDNNLVMKMDCEASEYDIIFGSRKEDILRFKTIYTEIHDNMHENQNYNHALFVDFMEKLGYRAEQIHNNHTLSGIWSYNPATGMNDLFTVPSHDVWQNLNPKGYQGYLYKFVRLQDIPNKEVFVPKYKYSIIIPTYNHLEDCLKPCIESIRTYTDLSNVEVLIIANGCRDGTVDYLKTLPQQFRTIWFDEPLGYTKATNIGIMESQGEYIILLNNDTVMLPQPTSSWLHMLEEPIIRDPNMGVTGPVKNYCPDANAEFMIFFCVMISRKVMDSIGLLDEIYSPGFGEDTDFCIRAKKLGYKIEQVPFAEKLQVAEIPDDRLHMYPNGKTFMNISAFPIYHKGEGTFENWGNEHTGAVDKNRKNLFNRFNKPLDLQKARNTVGWMTEEELQFLAHQARLHNVIIEVGSWHGRSSTGIVKNMQEDALLYCVDTWRGTPDEKVDEITQHKTADFMDGDYVYDKFLQNTFEYIKDKKIIPIRMHSIYAAEMFRKNNIIADMIFIDAGHTYEDVKKDILAWLPVLRKNGIMCGHDYHENGVAWPGVYKAVNEIFVNVRQVPFTSIWQIRKEW